MRGFVSVAAVAVIAVPGWIGTTVWLYRPPFRPLESTTLRLDRWRVRRVLSAPFDACDECLMRCYQVHSARSARNSRKWTERGAILTLKEQQLTV